MILLVYIKNSKGSGMKCKKQAIRNTEIPVPVCKLIHVDVILEEYFLNQIYLHAY
jgi:hypothetical protein